MTCPRRGLASADSRYWEVRALGCRPVSLPRPEGLECPFWERCDSRRCWACVQGADARRLELFEQLFENENRESS